MKPPRPVPQSLDTIYVCEQCGPHVKVNQNDRGNFCVICNSEVTEIEDTGLPIAGPLRSIKGAGEPDRDREQARKVAEEMVAQADIVNRKRAFEGHVHAAARDLFVKHGGETSDCADEALALVLAVNARLAAYEKEQTDIAQREFERAKAKGKQR